jgi:hypothetical protein
MQTIGTDTTGSTQTPGSGSSGGPQTETGATGGTGGTQVPPGENGPPVSNGNGNGVGVVASSSSSSSSSDDNSEPPPLPDDLKDVEQEIEAANAGKEPLNEFDGQKLKKCGNDVHPMAKMKRYMDDKKITEEYQNSKCDSDYHSSCSSAWKGCNTSASRACPKTCGKSDCAADLASLGKSDRDQPTYNDNCADNLKYNCSFLVDRGDCVLLQKMMSTLCPKTACLCSQTRDYLPYMPEEHKTMQWMNNHAGGKYKKLCKWIKHKKIVIRHKALKKKCDSKNN